MGILFSSQYPRQSAQTYSSEKPNQSAESKSEPKPFWESAATDPVAAFTLGLVLVGAFQVGLFYVQLKLIRTSLNDAKIAADAAASAANAASRQADAAEKTLATIERPYVFIFGVRQLDYNSPEFYVRYTVANYGKIPAIIDEVFAGFVPFDGGEMPLPLGKDDDHGLSVNPVLESGEKMDALREYIPEGMDTGAIHVVVGEENAFGFDQSQGRISPEWNVPPNSDVYFRVVIRYHGPFSKGHETAAAWWCMTGSSHLLLRGGEDYNYNR